MPWRGPEYEGEVPTLGWDVLDWMTEYLVVPDGPTAGDPLELTPEQAQFILNFYRIDPHFEGPAVRGRGLVNSRLINRAILCRPKGWGKSPILAALGIVEGVGDVIHDGWDANGEPVARPWTSLGFKAKVQVLATSEDQTSNTWDPLLDMVRGSTDLIDDYGLDPMETFVAFERGRIEFATSAGDSREGGRPIFAVLDQTESWRTTNGGVKLAGAVRRNLTKTGGSSIESPNAYAPGDKSVAERSFAAHAAQRLRAKNSGSRGRATILLDHRAAPEVNIYDEDALKRGLAIAYGDSADVNGGWVNLDRVVEDFWDPDSTVEDSSRFFLNQVEARADAWLSEPEVRGVNGNPDAGGRADLAVRPIASGDVITLGFDGSRGRTRGITDATALIGCRVSDGHLFELFDRSVWEQPAKWPRNEKWQPPIAEVLATVAKAFTTYKVVAFYADPALWESYVAGWEAQYGSKLLVKSSRQHPIEWWMTGGRAFKSVQALKQFRDAVLDQELSYDGSLALTAHLLNARMVPTRSGVQIAKQHPDSADKIDAAVAAVLAYQARLDAIAAGALKVRRKPRQTARKLR